MNNPFVPVRLEASARLVAAFIAVACSSGEPGPAGSGGSASNTAGEPATGGTPTAGGASGGQAGSGGDAKTAGGSGGGTAGQASGAAGGGAGGVGGIGGSPLAGSGGTSMAGTGGSGGTGGMGGSGGTGGSGGATTRVCPDGPFPTPSVVSTKSVCGDFNFDYSWNEGPTWVESQKAFFFSNFVAGSASGGNIVKYTPGAGCEVFLRDVGCNGLAASNDGNLLAACQQTRSVVRFDLTTKKPTTVADSYMGKMLDTPNDLVQHSNGSVYFTNPTNELAGRPVGVGPAAFRVDPSGQVSMISSGDCNGIALSPDEKTLYVLLLGMWDLNAQGVPSNKQALFTQGDGMAVDCAGNVYASGSIFSASGQKIGSWGTGTNLAFGGTDHKTVLVAGPGKQLRELTLNVPGLP